MIKIEGELGIDIESLIKDIRNKYQIPTIKQARRLLFESMRYSLVVAEVFGVIENLLIEEAKQNDKQ